MSRPITLPAFLLRLLCAVAVLWGGMTRSNPAFSVAPMAADLALYALPDGSLPLLCLPGGADDATGKTMAGHLCDLCLLGVSVLPLGAGSPVLRVHLPVQQVDFLPRPEALYRQFFPPQAPPIGPPTRAIA
ncbi:hypothetical protein GCM10011497_23990 [Elstera cyanobacteriorum]|uniref:DUF2946 domain-containing protein n=1 Tax=Elstera cyanobacteriorum TaxID=2022747 RepID=A0A255XK48_9PROT|nr:hypothetical protein [Elstera cyanobacteriorum]OYQ17347.1 hypothetical protein CHR90_15395 [Elstera cyanobacteriorum]GFZ93123.1 hypothetical protein GCM10011497_23990 [Elstera cyanobacteriorum]